MRIFWISMMLAACPLFGKIDLFVSSHCNTQSRVLAFWGGESVQLRILSNQELEQPSISVLSKALVAPVELVNAQFQSSQLEDGLYQHDFEFRCPEPKSQLRYIMRFNEVDGAVLFDAYPLWLRTQTARQAAELSIMIKPNNATADAFFTALGIDLMPKEGTPIQVQHSENELLIQKPERRFIWKTNCGSLDIDDPRSVLGFSEVVKTIRELN